MWQEHFERPEAGPLREPFSRSRDLAVSLAGDALPRAVATGLKDRVAAGYGRAGPSPRPGFAWAVSSSS